MMSRVSARQDMKIQKLHKIKCKKRSNLVQSGKPFWNVTINSYDNICITHLQMLCKGEWIVDELDYVKLGQTAKSKN